ALYADDPQSHSAQASTIRRLIRPPTVSGGRTSSALSTRSFSVMDPRSAPRQLSLSPQPALEEHLFQHLDAVGEDPIDTGIDESFHSFGVVDGPDMDFLAGSMNGLNQRRGEDGEPAAVYRERDGYLQRRCGRIECPGQPWQESVGRDAQWTSGGRVSARPDATALI